VSEQILINLKDALAKAEGGFENPMHRYNGGWCKTITGLDKSKDNGYSLKGGFIRKENCIAHQDVGLYLDCDIGGSRKNQRKYYTLFSLKPDGAVDVLEYFDSNKPDWAIHLWPFVEKYFADEQQTADSKRAALEAEAAQLRIRLEEIGQELKTL
jgi:hypothetical protein